MVFGTKKGISIQLDPHCSTLKVSGKQNSLFPVGPVIKCLLMPRKNLEPLTTQRTEALVQKPWNSELELMTNLVNNVSLILSGNFIPKNVSKSPPIRRVFQNQSVVVVKWHRVKRRKI